jgi:hypothetical protein
MVLPMKATRFLYFICGSSFGGFLSEGIVRQCSEERRIITIYLLIAWRMAECEQIGVHVA